MSARRLVSGGSHAGAMALAALLALAGCERAPLAPAPSGGSSAAAYEAPPVLKLHADGSTEFVSMPRALQAPAWDPYGAEAVFDPSRGLTVSTVIDGALGGRLVCGRYVLSFPAGVFDGKGAVTMTLTDSTLMLCDLTVTPESLNGFLKPVNLSLHTRGTDADLDSLQVYWWDTETSQWISMGCEASDSLLPVLEDEVETLGTVPGIELDLNHFSRYATGKAGW